MAPMPTLEFWYEFASPYSYIAAEEIELKALATGVAAVWRPFLLGPIFAAQGWKDSPFNIFPSKGAYMWRDVERLCADRSLPWRKPTVFPRNGLFAARIATAMTDYEMRKAFTKSVFRANFIEDKDISAPSVIAELLDNIGLPSVAWMGEAETDEIKNLLRRNTEEAISRGIFGAPSFVAKGELFWGGDRLDHALAWLVSRG
jgi:2-hydroxychromene-2-carboxylate isomerase